VGDASKYVMMKLLMEEFVDNWREIVADWQEGTAFTAQNAAGGKVQMGTSGDLVGMSPMELLLASLAGCTGSDVVSILEKERQPLKALEVCVRGKRRDDYPRVYTKIEVEYLLWGTNLQAKAIERAIQLSREKYCSVSAMLEPKAEVRVTYRMMPDQPAG
jgi:putative redox protein